jgi:hypothetical protein
MWMMSADGQKWRSPSELTMDDHKRPSMAMAQALGVAPPKMAIAAHGDAPLHVIAFTPLNYRNQTSIRN